MTKYEHALKALEALPEDRREEIAELVLELASAVAAVPGQSALTADQRAEVRRRRAAGFRPGDPDRIDALLARLS